MTARKSYTDGILQGGGSRLLRWQRFARFRRTARELAAVSQGRGLHTILDLGAADGIAMPFLRPLAQRVIGLNAGQEYSLQFRKAYPDDDTLTADGCAIPLRDECIDAVVSLETLYVVPGPAARRKCLAEIHRVLEPDGVFVCSVAIEVGLPAVIKYIGRRCAGIKARRITFGKMLRHWLYHFCDLSKYDHGGDHLGFNAYQFSRDVADRFEVLRRIRLPLCYPFCTTLMLVCRRR